ncbi:MAG TPA: YecA family protein [Candidatus Tumulicola sp.]|jgi:yecA family protein
MSQRHVIDMQDRAPRSAALERLQKTPRIWEFFSQIVRAATAAPQPDLVSPIPCRRRPSRRPCPGTIAVHRDQDREPMILWTCTACGDGGSIVGFEGMANDLGAQSTATDTARKRRKLRVDPQEYGSWISGDLLSYGPGELRAMYSAAYKSGSITISASEDELTMLLEALAADINRESRPSRRRNLEWIYDELERHEAGSRRPQRTAATSRSASPVEPDSAYAHGFFSAVVSGPMTMPSAWLPRFLSVKSQSLEALNAAAQIVMSAHNEVAQQLLEQRDSFDEVTLRLATSDETDDELINWQQGFCQAMDLNPDGWNEFLNDPSRKELLAPLGIIAQLSSDPKRREWLADKALRESIGRSVGIMTVRIWESYRNVPPV